MCFSRLVLLDQCFNVITGRRVVACGDLRLEEETDFFGKTDGKLSHDGLENSIILSLTHQVSLSYVVGVRSVLGQLEGRSVWREYCSDSIEGVGFLAVGDRKTGDRVGWLGLISIGSQV